MKNDPNKNGMTYTSHTLANKNRMTYASHTLPSCVCVYVCEAYVILFLFASVCEVYVIPFLFGSFFTVFHPYIDLHFVKCFLCYFVHNIMWQTVLSMSWWALFRNRGLYSGVGSHMHRNGVCNMTMTEQAKHNLCCYGNKKRGVYVAGPS